MDSNRGRGHINEAYSLLKGMVMFNSTRLFELLSNVRTKGDGLKLRTGQLQEEVRQNFFACST